MRLALSTAFCFILCEPALAYRPFDSTDADVAAPGEVEIEFGPVAYIDEPHASITKTPVMTLNVGLPKDWELVMDAERAVTRAPATPDDETFDTAVQLKHVVHAGSLQERSGWSFATEFGALLPDDNEEDHYGVTAALIGSLRLEQLTVHCNVAAARNRAGHGEWFGGIILEGNTARPVRPVAEARIEHEAGSDTSAYSSLLGAIWERSDNLSFDVALRGIREEGSWSYEGRIGLTWSFEFARM
jgi:hypothetical protein